MAMHNLLDMLGQNDKMLRALCLNLVKLCAVAGTTYSMVYCQPQRQLLAELIARHMVYNFSKVALLYAGYSAGIKLEGKLTKQSPGTTGRLHLQLSTPPKKKLFFAASFSGLIISRPPSCAIASTCSTPVRKSRGG